MTYDPKEDYPAFPAPEASRTDFDSPTIYAGLTKREYAAIHLRVPDSGSEWLDAMIRERMRDDLAQAAMQGLLAAQNDASMRGYEGWRDEFAREAYRYADAMLAARGGAR